MTQKPRLFMVLLVVLVAAARPASGGPRAVVRPAEVRLKMPGRTGSLLLRRRGRSFSWARIGRFGQSRWRPLERGARARTRFWQPAFWEARSLRLGLVARLEVKDALGYRIEQGGLVADFPALNMRLLWPDAGPPVTAFGAEGPVSLWSGQGMHYEAVVEGAYLTLDAAWDPGQVE